MKKLIVGSIAAVALTFLAPLTAYASAVPSALQPACVSSTLPGGATLQVGYAPNGPGGCVKV